MKNYIIREIEPECCDFSFFFDDDGLTGANGDFCNNLFIITNEGWGRLYGFNVEEYKNIMQEAEHVLDAIDDIKKPGDCYNWSAYKNYKEVMQDFSIPYSPTRAHALKEWAENADTDKIESIAEYLTIKTGHEWETDEVRGYCHGDYAQMLFCPEHYKNGVQEYGEIYLGCGKEFLFTELDENGEITDECGGLIVADCLITYDKSYKQVLCEWLGIPEEETELQMIDPYTTRTIYSYRII